MNNLTAAERAAITVRKPWTEAERELMRQHYPDTVTADLAKALGRAVQHVYSAAMRLGLYKSEAFAASDKSGRILKGGKLSQATQFQPGQPSWSKGTRGLVGVQPGCRASQFKKGRPAHEAHNYAPIGSHRLSKDGYLEQKVTDDPALVPARRWVAVHRLVWAEAHGPVPAGHVVAFLPGCRSADPALITLDALELVSRRDWMKRNTFHQYGPEVVKVTQLRGAITRQINKRAKAEVHAT